MNDLYKFMVNVSFVGLVFHTMERKMGYKLRDSSKMIEHAVEWKRLLRQAFSLSHCDGGFALQLAGRSRGGSF